MTNAQGTEVPQNLQNPEQPDDPKSMEQRKVSVPAKHTVFEHLHRPPGNFHKAKKMLAEQKKEGIRVQKSKEVFSAEHQEKVKQEFLNRTENKSDCNRIRQMIKCTKLTLNSDLQSKRIVLRDLLQGEQQLLEQELNEKMAHEQEDQKKRREIRLFTVKQERERRRKECVESKNVQKYMNSCEEIRPYLRQSILLDSKACQLAQIEENRRRKLDQKNMENMWLEVARRSSEQQYQNEERVREKRWHANQCMVQELNHQIQENRDARVLQKLVDVEIQRQEEADAASIKTEENRIREQRIQKQKTLAADLKEQREQVEKYKQIRGENDRRFLQMFHDSTAMEIQKEKNKISTAWKTHQRESKIFLDHLQQTKLERECEEYETEKLIEIERRKMEDKQFQIKQDFKMKRMELAQQTYTGLLAQIEDRELLRRQEASIKYREELEDQRRFCREMAQDVDKERERRLKSIDIANEQRCQAEYNRVRAQELRQEEIDFMNGVKQEQMKCERIARDYVEKNMDYLPLHANLLLMKTQCPK